ILRGRLLARPPPALRDDVRRAEDSRGPPPSPGRRAPGGGFGPGARGARALQEAGGVARAGAGAGRHARAVPEALRGRAMSRAVRIANAGGYWGDDPDAPRRQLLGGPIDYLTIDAL